MARGAAPGEPRLCTAAEAAALIRSRDRLAIPLGPGQPAELLHALSDREDFEDLEVSAALLLDLYPLFARPGVRLRSGFFGPAERGLVAAGHAVAFVPGDLRRFASVIEAMAPRVMATAVAAPDEHGRYSLSLHAGATAEALRACGRDPSRLLIAEVNPALPRTFGLPAGHGSSYRHELTAAEIDVVIESNRPLPTLDEPPAGAVEGAIARHVARFIRDGSTLQTGIGRVPNSVATLLAEGDGGDYGIHSEMFTTGLMRLHQAGKVSNRHKGVYDGFSVCTFAFGSAELHAWLHERDEVRFLPAALTNDPSVIARNRRMVSINGALAVDLAGQVMADTIDGRQHSGIGGHEDFVGGASMDRDDQSMLCLPATAQVDGRTVSRIVSRFPAGAIITTPRHQLDYVFTEFGVAEMRGRSTEERAEALVAVAHPDAREALRRGEPLRFLD